MSAVTTQNARGQIENAAKAKGSERMKRRVDEGRLPGCFEGLYQYFVYVRILGPLGGHEGAGLKMRVAGLDEDNNGTVSEKELKEQEEQVQIMLDSCKEFLLTCGVVASLVLSILFPIAIDSQEVDDDTVDFLGEDGADILKHVHDGLLGAGTVIAILAVLISVRNYVQLIFWMPTKKDQVLFVQTSGGQALLASLMMTDLWVLQFAVATGSTLARGPFAGLVVLILGTLGMAYFSRYELSTTAWCGALLHMRAVELAGDGKSAEAKNGAGNLRQVGAEAS
mmetsp:Transcript_36653/g.67193  ORF Transcript_36653/g.67193 Transcript_36653/m.67193 type:complete len:281 (+) Transcript_36653:129-971(+)